VSKRKQSSHRPESVLLIGDVILDVYRYGEGQGRSIEAPVPVGLEERVERSWGGAGLVARNLLSLGARTVFCTAAGDDEWGRVLRAWTHPRLSVRAISQKGRATVVKERFVIGTEKVLRWNKGRPAPLSDSIRRAFMREVSKALPRVSVVLVSDYRGGILSRPLIARILKEARLAGVPVWVDSQVVRTSPNHLWYRGADMICLNEAEVRAVMPRFSSKDLRHSLEALSALLKARSIIVKLGSRGAAGLYDGKYVRTPAVRVKEIDAVGAGDAFFAALGAGGDLSPRALRRAAAWAAAAVTMRGTEPPTKAMLKKLKWDTA
jgi:rfaE bifunctional protein kinase chain/domain